ncbi:hypothetical protein Baya_15898 [Bagarius yarrelli]|uniref:Uncharacterized protein n=1 Tax=Bagarius yarrelli TaxID=175774 RepID=A0A556VKY7_BAGYA|nr:hypothetical protein Baya_15898 [Bagarius yarrelli]
MKAIFLLDGPGRSVVRSKSDRCSSSGGEWRLGRVIGSGKYSAENNEDEDEKNKDDKNENNEDDEDETNGDEDKNNENEDDENNEEED